MVAGSLSARNPLFHTQRLCGETIRGRYNQQFIPRPTVCDSPQDSSRPHETNFDWWVRHFAPPALKKALVVYLQGFTRSTLRET